MNVLNQLILEAKNNNDKLAIMDFNHFSEIKVNLDKMGFPTERYFDFSPRLEEGFDVCSVIIVAYATPLVSMEFMINGESKLFYISPGYNSQHNKEKIIFDYLSPILLKNGHNLSMAKKLPCKPVAVHTGLGVYGRNNIVYVDNMGSFCRFSLYLTDLSSDEAFFDEEANQKNKESCAECNICLNECPTTALNNNQYNLDISRCLCWMTLMDVGSPEWVNPEWHNALLGCMSCQRKCPQNADFVKNIVNIGKYDETQTKALLEDTADEELIASLGCGAYNRLIPRNLRTLLGFLGN